MLQVQELTGPRDAIEAPPSLAIRLLGNFELLQAGSPVAIVNGGKLEALLSLLALRYDRPVPRDTILDLLWPNHDATLAGQSLCSVVYSLRRQLGQAGAPLILYAQGCYGINPAADVRIDSACFDALVQDGDRCRRAGDPTAALVAYGRAVALYRGDLWLGLDVAAVVERERLRARYLTVLARLADRHYAQGEYTDCLDYAGRLLVGDPCREDAHRLMMRCYLRRGERAQALRQYQLCVALLRAEFDTVPEQATTALYEQVRCDPAAV